MSTETSKMSTVTIGEAIARRRLKQSTMPGSREVLYVPGQYHAARLSEEDCTVSWVDANGVVNIMPCELNDEEWVRKGVLIAVTAKGHVWARNIPTGTGLTGFQIDAIRNKYDENDEEPPPSGPDDEGSSQGAGEQ